MIVCLMGYGSTKFKTRQFWVLELAHTAGSAKTVRTSRQREGEETVGPLMSVIPAAVFT